ncbi:MAG TPA: S-methyl-5'-thioadenosine phosphorylase [Clostridia bacterium]|nr:S-methyl-5'-thioadenosine phosphorylase [Clostridia bacterium]
MPVKIAVIGGSGVYDPEMLDHISEDCVDTAYGKVNLTVGEYRGKRIAFLPRHGQDHSVPPHLINYRANIMALKEIGVKSILATAAVGTLNPEIKPEVFVFVDQFLDYTKARLHTFFGESKEGVVHLDMTEPYCADLRKVLGRAAKRLGFNYHTEGTYVCTEGPRFETPAEINMFRLLGGDVIGMTGVPECTLAREAEICYATIAMVTNYAAGMTKESLSHQEVLDIMAGNIKRLKDLVMDAIASLDENRSCGCQTISR